MASEVNWLHNGLFFHWTLLCNSRSNPAALVHGDETRKVLLDPIHLPQHFPQSAFVIVNPGVMVADLKGSVAHSILHLFYVTGYLPVIHDSYGNHLIQTPQIFLNVLDTYIVPWLSHPVRINGNIYTIELSVQRINS